MANNSVVSVKVEKLTKFGYADAKGFVSYSKNMSDSDKALVVPGAEFEAEIYTAESGARYLNKIVARAPHVTAPKAKVVEVKASAVVTEGPKAKTGTSESMTKAEWSAKDRSQLIGGLSHDAAELVAAIFPILPMHPAEAVDSVLSIYKEVLVGLLKIRDEVR
jgi:hypothetical protein